MTLLQTFRDGPSRSRRDTAKWQNAMGVAALFAIALGVVWAMVKLLGLTWDRALLVEILWLTTMNRWHQPEKGAHNGS